MGAENNPNFKVYSPQGEYIASCKYAEDAATLCGMYGDGTIVRYRHSLILWRQGQENVHADESLDVAADIMLKRLSESGKRV